MKRKKNKMSTADISIWDIIKIDVGEISVIGRYTDGKPAGHIRVIEITKKDGSKIKLSLHTRGDDRLLVFNMVKGWW
jgi:hypothetical protein